MTESSLRVSQLEVPGDSQIGNHLIDCHHENALKPSLLGAAGHTHFVREADGHASIERELCFNG